jgi:sugar lactone lactonase YvrE
VVRTKSQYPGRIFGWAVVCAMSLVWLSLSAPAYSQEAGFEAARGKVLPQALWMTDYHSFNEFKSGRIKKSGTPKANLKFGGDAGGITFDNKGNLWGSLSSGVPSGWIFGLTPGDIKTLRKRHRTTPSISIIGSGSQWYFPAALGISPAGNLWFVATGPNAVPELVEFTADQFGQQVTAPPAVIIQVPDCFYLSGMSFDRSGDLWVAGVILSTGTGALYEYTPGQLTSSGTVTPALTVTRAQDSMHFVPNGIAFDGNGNLWAADSPALYGLPAKLELFAASDLAGSGDSSANPIVTIDSVTTPLGLAFDQGGNLWVADFLDIREFTPGQIAASGSPDPVTILKAGKRLKNFVVAVNLVFGPAY